MNNYVVITEVDSELSSIPEWVFFSCLAIDEEDAHYKCMGVYPHSTILWVHEGHDHDQASEEYSINKIGE